MKSNYTAAELDAAPDLPLDHLAGYVSLPKGYVCKAGIDYSIQLIYHPETKHVMIYTYSETTGYGDSSTDIVYNGHYNLSEEYQAQ